MELKDMKAMVQECMDQGGDIATLMNNITTMSAAGTTSLGLNQWQLSNKPQMQDFNRDNQILDREISALKTGKANLAGANFASLKQNGNTVFDAGSPLITNANITVLENINTDTKFFTVHSSSNTIGGILLVTGRSYREISVTAYSMIARIDCIAFEEIKYTNTFSPTERYLTVSAKIENYVNSTNYDIVFYAKSPQPSARVSATFLGINSVV